MFSRFSETWSRRHRRFAVTLFSFSGFRVFRGSRISMVFGDRKRKKPAAGMGPDAGFWMS
jgi:hypothetical protein